MINKVNANSFNFLIKREHRRSKFGDVFMKTALLFSEVSTCARIKVGAVLVKNNRIISTGFNGTPPGILHCEDYFLGREVDDQEHKEFSLKYELHAEQNLLGECLKNGINPTGGEIYITLSPCISCAKSLLTAGIKKVYYLNLYDRETDGIKLLNDNSVICEQYTLGE